MSVCVELERQHWDYKSSLPASTDQSMPEFAVARRGPIRMSLEQLALGRTILDLRERCVDLHKFTLFHGNAREQPKSAPANQLDPRPPSDAQIHHSRQDAFRLK